jgi:hypothetical protein
MDRRRPASLAGLHDQIRSPRQAWLESAKEHGAAIECEAAIGQGTNASA